MSTDKKYDKMLHIRKDKDVIDLPTLSFDNYHDGWSLHKLNVWAEHPDGNKDDTKNFKTVNSVLCEHRFAPLLQDSIETPLFIKIDGGIYNIDPLYDFSTFSNSQVFYIRNAGGTIKDLASHGYKTTVAGDVIAEQDADGFELKDKACVKLESTSSVRMNDFTLIADVKFNGSENKRNTIFATFGNSITLGIDNTLDAVWFSIGGKENRIKLQKPLELGKEYRFVLQRKSSLCDLWVSGLHVGGPVIVQKDAITKEDAYIGSSSDGKSDYLCGEANNVILCEKALLEGIRLEHDEYGQDIVEKEVRIF